ncbi:MAG: hypothetical protein ACK5KU_06135, partial [Beutenbergiaceae bacterium]
MNNRILNSVGLITFSALILTGCATEGADDANGNLSPEDSPLAVAFQELDVFADASQEEVQQEDYEQQRQVEEIISACMSDQGFSYIPADPTTQSIAESQTTDRTSREYAEQYGYGITTADEMDPADSDGISEDPNDAAYEQMSSSEQQAYDLALWGPPQADEDASIDESQSIHDEASLDEMGCYGQAVLQVHEDADEDAGEIEEDPRFQEFFQALDDFYTQLPSDPAFASLNSEWSSCMADAGHSGLAIQVDAEESVWDAYETLWTDAE